MHILRKRLREVKAPLNRVTYAGSPNYYLKLVDLSTQSPVLFPSFGQESRFPQRCRLADTKCDLRTELAGMAKPISLAPDQLQQSGLELIFERDGDKVTGYTLQLQKQVDGNLRETRSRLGLLSC